jgi:hypothetical protein
MASVTRSYFFITPLMSIQMLCVSIPPDFVTDVNFSGLKTIWLITLILQIILDLKYFTNWMYTEDHSFDKMGCTCLLSIVGWLF